MAAVAQFNLKPRRGRAENRCALMCGRPQSVPRGSLHVCLECAAVIDAIALEDQARGSARARSRAGWSAAALRAIDPSRDDAITAPAEPTPWA